MIRSLVLSLLTVSSLAHADTVGSYSKCKPLGANAAACTACLRGGQFYNFDTTRKKWVCGNTTDMKRSTPMTKPSKTPVKPATRPVKKR